jgi:hypothetical protein
MSETRSEVLSLLKQFDQEFTVFDGAEESFILALAQDRLAGQQHCVDWQRLSKATFVLPLCHIRLRERSLAGVPDWFARQAKGCYLHQVSANESRVAQIKELACLFEEAGLKVLFLKGAAELAYSPDDTDLFGRRYMCDIDLLCAAEDLPRVDALVRSNGYQLWDHGLKHWNREQVCEFSLKRYSHYIYNAYSKNYMELHGHVAVGANRLSYPPDFETLLMDHSRQVDVRGTRVWVPKPEYLVVYALCHAASRSNNQALIYLDRFYLDEFAGTDCVVSPPVLVNRRLDISQLRFLVQLRDLLARFDGQLDFAEVKSLLSKVGERDLNDMYALVASYVFRERFPIVPAATAEAIKMSRHRYVSMYMLPLLAERIESIIASRLEQVTSDYIEQQVEKIAVSVERRVIHCVTERLIESAKTFIKRRVRNMIPASYRKDSKSNLRLEQIESSSC